MSYSCSQCTFTAQFATALSMHRQLHHGAAGAGARDRYKANIANEKSNTVPRAACFDQQLDGSDGKGLKLARTSSATRLLGRLRARICRSKSLFAHPEEGANHLQDLGTLSECSSRALKSPTCPSPVLDTPRDSGKEIFACHLCSFDADRITVLDRHLLTDHKIGLENLLQLVMAKTKDGLSTDTTATNMYGFRTPYYKPPDQMIEEGEFIIETVTPKIKILKHSAVNTDLKGSDIVELKNRFIDEEMDKLMELNDSGDKGDLMEKMKTLNECMCKFVDSSNTLKKVLSKEFDQKSIRNDRSNDLPAFDLRLEDQNQETPRNWDRPNSEKIERSRAKYEENRGGSEKVMNSPESIYF